jgi:hypothetical protein
MRNLYIRILILSLPVGFSGCGTMVPQIGEFWEDNRGISSHDLEIKIKEKIFCELQKAVSDIDNPSIREPFKQYYLGKEIDIPPIPKSWGVQMTLNLIVEENTALNPGATYTEPWKPGVLRGMPAPQSFAIGFGGGLSADATRTDKFTFYYLITDLTGDEPSCHPENRDPADNFGTSLLLESDLGIHKWLNNAMNLRSSVGISRPSQQEVMTYDVKFDIISSGNFTPTWKLVYVTSGSNGGNFFSTKRDRTHEMILTFGPAQSAPGGGKQPGVIASNDALAQQIGTAVGAAVEKALAQGLAPF